VTSRQSIASMNLIGGILSVAGLAAAVAAVAQLARQQVRLRDDLDELRSAKLPGSAGPEKARGDAPRLFGELYETKPSPFEALGEWPGVPLALAAAGLFAIGMVTGRPRQAPQGSSDSTVAVELAAARLRYDSLATEVDELRDSLAALQKPSVPTRNAARVATTPVKRAGATALARPAVPKAPGIAPLPALPKVESAP
jgi:hypothetical protein